MKSAILLILALASSLSAKTGLIVTTVTGDESGAGTNMQVFLQINGEGKKYALDGQGDDREIAATNIYPGIVLEEEIGDIKFIELSVTKEDAWLLTMIQFDFISNGESIGKAKFKRKEWLSAENEENMKSKRSVKFMLDGRIK